MATNRTSSGETPSRERRKQRGLKPKAIKDRTTGDPGDATGRNFRYQYAYGAMLLIGAKTKKLPYIAIWCEHHEDFLAERADERFDAYQIKTSRPEAGPWKLSDSELTKSIGRFVDLVEAYEEKIVDLFFVSNTECDKVTSESSDERRRARCPIHFLEHIRKCENEKNISPPYETTFRELQAECGCSPEALFKTLRRMDIILGPSRNDFEAVLSNQHLSTVDGCGQLATIDLDAFRDEIIAHVHRASTLQVTDPRRHTRSVIDGKGQDPAVVAKRLTAAEIVTYLPERPRFIFTGSPELALGASRPPHILERKLEHGKLSEEIDRMRDLERDAEYNLLEDASRRPERYPGLLRRLEQLVLGECSEAHLRARQIGEPYGAVMLIEIQDRLRRLSNDERELIGEHSYECLLGIAALLTSDCRVWWSPRFAISEDTRS